MLLRIGVSIALCVCAIGLRAELLLDARAVELKPQKRPVLFVPVIGENITLDGKLDEPAWKNAGVIDGWVDHDGGAPTELDAEIRVLASREFLYVGCTLRGTQGLELAKPSGGGKDEYEGSVLEMFFDPDANGKTKVQIVTNPLGLRYDSFDSKPAWNGAWKSAGQVSEDAWTIEVAIPVSEMNNQQPGVVPRWKANFAFYFRRDGEQMNSWTGGWGAPGSDYGELFFGTREQYEQTLKPGVVLFLDRVVYDLRDATAVALVRFDAAGEAQADLSLQLSVRQGKKTVIAQTIAKPPGTNVDCTLDLKSLASGDYTLHADLLKQGQPIASADRAFSKKDRRVQPAPVTSGKIPITVQPQKDLAGIVWPITTGVPFSQGSLASASNVRLLDPSGKEVPFQTDVRSTWGRQGPVQWLGLDFVPKLSDGEQVYTLEYGPDVKAAGTGKLDVRQTDDQISVNTGPLQFTVNRKRFALISSASMDGDQVIKPANHAGLSLVDHEGNRYRSVNDKQVQVTVEEAGPVRVTICAKGWYVKDGTDGSRTSCELPTDRLCLFTVRMSAFAGSSLVKMAVSTTLTQDTQKVRLRELTIGFPVSPGEIRVGDHKLADNGYLLQDRWDRAIDAAGKEHPRLDGWIETPGLRIAVRRFWQLFPKEIGHANGLLTIHPWPAHGHDVFAMDDQIQMQNIYKLWYAHHGREQNFSLPPQYTKRLDDELVAHPKTFSAYYKDMSYANAQGLTIHNDLLLSFGPTVNGATLNKLVNTDPHALPDPAYTCAANVFGPILHADPQFAELEQTYQRGYQHFIDRKHSANEYGMLIYGNGHTYWSYGKNHALVHRVWINNHYLISRLPLVQYARSGDPRWINVPGGGRDLANTLRDIATVNYVSPERRFKYHQLGAMYHCKGFAPWAGDAHVAAHPICANYLIYDYYLFGNRRSLDTLHNWIAGLKEASPGGYPTREGMTSMAEMIEAYRLTWDAALVELIERFRQAILRQPAGEPEYPSWDYHPLLCVRDYELSGDPRMLQAFRELVAKSPDSEVTGGYLHYHALFSLIDNDPRPMESWTRRLYRDSISAVHRPGEFGDGLVNNSWYPFVYPAHKYPYALKAIKQFGLKLERPNVTRPAPVAVADKRTLIAVKETTDGAIPVTIACKRTPESEITVRVLRADGSQVAEGRRPVSKDNAPLSLTIPADGQAGEYLIEIRRGSEYDDVLWPVTTLPHEVALLPATGEIMMNTIVEGLCLYVLPPHADAAPWTLRTRSSRAVATELFDAKGNALHETTVGENAGVTATLNIPAGASTPLFLYTTGETRVTLPPTSGNSQAAWIVALTRESLFQPTITPPR